MAGFLYVFDRFLLLVEVVLLLVGWFAFSEEVVFLVGVFICLLFFCLGLSNSKRKKEPEAVAEAMLYMQFGCL